MSAVPPNSDHVSMDSSGASDEQIQSVHELLTHQKPMPAEGYSPLPIAVLFIFSALIMVSGVYMGRYSGEFNALVYDENYKPSVDKTVAVAPKVDPVKQGEKLFNTAGACVTCHQANGQGLPAVFPPLDGSEWVNGPDERVVRIVLNGLTGPVKVTGKDFNGAMPAFGPGGGFNWKDEQIASVLTYVRQAWGNKSEAITVEKVAEIRGQLNGKKDPWSADDLMKIGAK